MDMIVECINDKDFPNEVPLSKRPKKGLLYTVIDAIKCNTQGGALGFVLEEIDLSGCDPYKCFSASRFMPVDEDNSSVMDEEIKDVMRVTETSLSNA